MEKETLVSVITPVHNCETYLSKSIESVLHQTHNNLEYILIDDCSSDSSREIIKYYSGRDSRIKFHFQSENRGPSKARNEGIACSKGEYIAFIDADDLWAENKLEEQLNAFLKNDKLGLIGTNGYVVDESGNEKGKMLADSKIKAGKISAKEFILEGVPVATSAAIIKHECINTCGCFNEDYFIAEDYLLWLKICQKYDMCILNIPLIYYRQHEQSLTGNKVRNRREKLRLFENEIITDPELMKQLGEEFQYKLQRMYCSLGNMYRKEGKREDAEEQFKKSLKYNINLFVTLKTQLYRMFLALH